MSKSMYSSPTQPKLAPLQRALTNPRSHKPFTRFKPAVQAGSGVNPHGGFIEFLKKDPVRNIDVYRDSRPPAPDISHMQHKWAIGTTKDNFSKVDNEGKLIRSSIEARTFPRNPTDCISYDPPANERPFQKVFDEMITKPKYNINVPSSHPWVPQTNAAKTINNRSSVGHNIISHEMNPHSAALVPGLLDKRVTNMKKGIGEFGDLMRPSAININVDHQRAYEDNPHVFKRKMGTCGYLYEAAHRFGESKPFKH